MPSSGYSSQQSWAHAQFRTTKIQFFSVPAAALFSEFERATCHFLSVLPALV